jgi:hypothetical protein
VKKPRKKKRCPRIRIKLPPLRCAMEVDGGREVLDLEDDQTPNHCRNLEEAVVGVERYSRLVVPGVDASGPLAINPIITSPMQQ